MLFKYSLILLRYSSADRVLFSSPFLLYFYHYISPLLQPLHFVFNIIVTPKIACSCWFINICQYSIFNCFNFSFLSKKIFCIFNFSVIQFFFQSKRFLISLILFSFSGLGFSIIICYEKNNFLKESESLLYFLKKIRTFCL